MLRLLPYYRWGMVFAGFVAVLLLGRVVYAAILPAEAWIDRGWYALRDQQYARAARCFKRAQAKAPRSDVPGVALRATYMQQAKGTPPTRFGPFARLPFLGGYLDSREKTDIDAQRESAESALAKSDAWRAARFGDFPAETVFVDFWKICPNEVPHLLTAVTNVHQGRFAEAWKGFRALETRHPRAFHLLCESESACVTYYGEAAWRTGRSREIRRLLRTHAGKQAVKQSEAYYRAFLPNLRMSHPGMSIRARHWQVKGANVKPANLGGAGDLPGLAVIPARDGAHVLYVYPWKPTAPEPTVQWWQWSAGTWRRRPAKQIETLARLLERPSSLKVPDQPVFDTHYAWSGGKEYLALRGDMLGDYTSVLLTLDGAVSQRLGHSPKEIVACGGDLWVREDMEFSRLTADGAVISYRGRTVMRSGAVFEEAQVLPVSSVELDQEWQLATDTRHRLWLVSWDGNTVIPRAIWEDGAFRKATAAEVSGAEGGIVDSANRVWFTGNLPKGFARDAWRVCPGLPRITAPATYAVDASGRVWMVCGGIAACWQDGRWVSVAQHLPLFAHFRTITAVDSGVMVLAGDRICYLE